MRRLPVVVLSVLVVGTVAAFFVTQHLKVTTPLLNGFPAPDPNVIDPIAGGTCGGLPHRITRVSFWLQHRSDDVDVYVIDQSGNVVDTVASGRHMRAGVRHPDGEFAWDGRLSDGSLAPDGTYYFRVSLIHQGRTVVISNAAGPEPITVQTGPPRPRVTSVSPGLVPQGGRLPTRISLTADDARGGYVNLYRTDLPGPPRLAKTFGLPWGAREVVWDGTIGGRPAPAGTYLVGLTATNAACRTGRFPDRIPPPAGSTPHAGVTVRYIAAAPPLDPIGTPIVQVYSAVGSYAWSLRRAGTGQPLATGTGSGQRLVVPVPTGRAGLYELTLRAKGHATTVPIVARSPRPEPILVVLPALSWQGLNPVDETGEGLPNTLEAGGPITLARVLADGLPPGFADEAGLVAYLDARHRAYDLTTDLGLIDGIGPALRGHRLVVLAGSERWLPVALQSAVRSYVENGGRVLSLGIDSLRRRVTIRGGRASDPTAPTRADALGATRGAVARSGVSSLTVLGDELGIFHGALPRTRAFESLSVASPLAVAGTASGQAAIVAYGLGHGTVVDIGLVGFGRGLAHDRRAQALVQNILKVVAG